MANFRKIKDIASEKGISLNELAAEIGCTPQAISLIIRKGSTITTTLEDISRVLGVSPSVFFDDVPVNVQDGTKDFDELLKQKDAIISQKDKLIEQKDEIIRLLTQGQRP